jgi:hypothetical protein
MGLRGGKRVAAAVGILLMTLGLIASANAAEPGQLLWNFFEILVTPDDGLFSAATAVDQVFFDGSNGDNILRLVNPNGAANLNLAGAKNQTVCAMIYVFDAQQEMGECCGCPVSPGGLTTFSVEHNLIANWSIGGPFSVTTGAFAVVAAAPNAPLTCLGQSGACNGGCDPSNNPGYSVNPANNLLGSMTHNQLQAEIVGTSVQETADITETGLFDDSAGDPNNLAYLQEQCGALIGNSTGGGICSCPTE